MLTDFEEVLNGLRNSIINRRLDEYPDEEALEVTLRRFAPAIVFMSLEEPETAERLATVIHTVSRGTQVVALATAFCTDLLYASVRAGMREFLSQPFDSGVIKNTLDRLILLLHHSPPTIQYSRNVFGFVSAKPGSGATTLALHTALELARQSGLKTLLLDFDFRASMLAFLLKQTNRFGITDAAEYHSELDETLWQRMATPVGPIDCVVAGKITGRGGLCPETLLSFLNYAQRNYDVICVDLPSGLDAQLPLIASECTSIFLVCTPEVGPLHLANRSLASFQDLGIAGRAKVVVNRAVPNSVMDRCADQVLSDRVFARIPNAYCDLQRAIQEGRTIDRRTKYGRGIEKLVSQCLGKAPAQKNTTIASFVRALLPARRPVLEPDFERPRLALPPAS